MYVIIGDCVYLSSKMVVFVTGIPVFELVPALAPLYDLIVKNQLSEEDGSDAPAPARSMRFYAVSDIYAI